MKKGQLQIEVSELTKKGYKKTNDISRVTLLSMAAGFELIGYMKSKDFEVVGHGGDDKNIWVMIDTVDNKKKKSLMVEVKGKNLEKYSVISQWRKKECRILFLDKNKTKYKFIESKSF